MSEFRIHHDVNELLSLLHVRGGDGAEGYIDLLQKHRTPYVTTTVSAHSAKVRMKRNASVHCFSKWGPGVPEGFQGSPVERGIIAFHYNSICK